MTLKTVGTVIINFLETDKPEVLALKGAWGVGKTYFWNKLIKNNKSDIKLKNYCYVSLFGIASASDLYTAIFAKTRPTSNIGQAISLQSANDLMSRIKKVAPLLASL